jgi:MFS family permease
MSIIISSIVGTFFLGKARKIQVLKTWVIFGVLVSLLTVFLAKYFSEWIIISLFLLGVSFGIATPFCLDLLIKVSAIEDRGKIGGVISFVTFSIVFILYRIILPLDLASTGIFLALWRCWSLPIVFLIKEELFQRNHDSQEMQKLILKLKNRAFWLYFTAWLMFSFIDSFQGIILNTKAEEFAFFIKLIEPCVASFSVIIIGAISDIIRRKNVLVFSFTFLGVAYAILGLFPRSFTAWFLYSIIDGVAIGSAFVLFVIVIWGEIAVGNSAIFYAIGGIPLFIAEALSLMLKEYLVLIPLSNSFSLASFFLFIAVIPLLFAPETLPEKVLKERELRSYIKRAKKVREKFAKL